MIKKQFTQGARLNLEGQTLGTLRVQWGNTGGGVCFPKVKCNNITVYLWTKGHYSSDSGTRNMIVRFFNDGTQVSQQNVSCRYNKNNANTVTQMQITDGRIINQIILDQRAYDPSALGVQVIFNDVEYVD